MGRSPLTRPRRPTSPTEAIRRRSSADRAILVGVSLAVVAALALVAAQCVDVVALDLRVRALDSDTHRSIFGVISLLAQAGAVLAVGVRCPSSSRRASWALLDALIAVLLVVRGLRPDQPVAFAVPVVAVFMLFWWLTTDDHHAARTVLRVGLSVLGLSFVIHIVGPTLLNGFGFRHGSWAYELTGISKHSTELAGWILVSTGVLAGWLAARQPTRRHVSSTLRQGRSAA